MVTNLYKAGKVVLTMHKSHHFKCVYTYLVIIIVVVVVAVAVVKPGWWLTTMAIILPKQHDNNHDKLPWIILKLEIQKYSPFQLV